MNIYKNLQQYYLSKFYLIYPAAMILITCTGAFVTYFLTQKGMTPLNFTLMFLSVVGATLYLAAILGQMPRKTTFIIFFWVCYWKLYFLPGL